MASAANEAGGARGRARLPLAVTIGEPAGIGPELIWRAWQAAIGRDADIPPFAAIGDADFLAAYSRRLGSARPIERCQPDGVAAVFARALPVVDPGLRMEAEPGLPRAANAPAVIAAIETAVRLVRDGFFAGLVTGPIAKHVLRDSGFAYPGHTEFLGALVERYWGRPALPVMMIWSPGLAVVPVTVHVPLSQALRELTSDLIVETGRIVARELAERFGIREARLAVSGLNPHAGENGTIGSEDGTTVAPAVARLKALGIAASGPFPADTLFHPQARASYDAVLCMYHDQALIPIKTIAFDEAVNVTLGLPFLRTSPDHGTAFDIAGKGIARPDSFIAALRLAGRLALADRAPALAS